MILKADRIVTGDGLTVLDNGAVYIAGEKITEIDELATLKAKYPDSPVKEYKGASIMPGLIDMHVHVGYWRSQIDAPTYNDYKIAYFAADYLKKAFSKGVTTIRDLGSPKNLSVSINSAVKSGFLEVPRILPADAPLCFTGGHSHMGNGWEVNGPWEIRAAIRDLIKRGAQWIKLMESHRSDTPEFTQEELDAAVDECHRVNKKTMVHAGTQPAIQMCIDAGFDTIEHATDLTADQAGQMAEKGIVWVPTIVAYTQTYKHIMNNLNNLNNEGIDAVTRRFIDQRAYFEKAAATYKENFRKLYETGVKIVTGTDLVYYKAPVTPVASEMKYMVEYGMPAIEAIRSATKTSAETLRIDDIGEIAVGNIADILIVTGNPVQDIDAVENVAEVYQSGKSVYRAC
ncbi:Xaa-Pro dipeptidase [Synergistales bacterium]|nr:Xaa-Pro dipeptidase [Synergistales bacterium]